MRHDIVANKVRHCEADAIRMANPDLRISDPSGARHVMHQEWMLATAEGAKMPAPRLALRVLHAQPGHPAAEVRGRVASRIGVVPVEPTDIQGLRVSRATHDIRVIRVRIEVTKPSHRWAGC